MAKQGAHGVPPSNSKKSGNPSPSTAGSPPSTGSPSSVPVPSPSAVATLRLEANKRTLLKVDPALARVLATASHAAMYELVGGKAAAVWEKKDVEGSLFITERNSSVR